MAASALASPGACRCPLIVSSFLPSRARSLPWKYTSRDRRWAGRSFSALRRDRGLPVYKIVPGRDSAPPGLVVAVPRDRGLEAILERPCRSPSERPADLFVGDRI